MHDVRGSAFGEEGAAHVPGLVLVDGGAPLGRAVGEGETRALGDHGEHAALGGPDGAKVRVLGRRAARPGERERGEQGEGQDGEGTSVHGNLRRWRSTHGRPSGTDVGWDPDRSAFRARPGRGVVIEIRSDDQGPAEADGH